MTFKFVSIYQPNARARKRDPYRLAVQLPGGRRRYITGHTKRGESERLAERLSDIAQMIHAGHATEADLDATLAKTIPLATHITDYHDHLYDVGRTKKHADQMWQYVGRILKDVRHVDALTPIKVELAIAKIKGSTATRKRHLDAIKAFLSWGYRDRRWGRGPLDAVAGLRVKSSRERVRRVLSIEQLAHLLATTESGPSRENCAGSNRAIIYRATLAAGLRAGELPHVEVSGDRIKIPASKTKNRKPASIRIPKAMADALVLAGLAWWAIKPGNLARMLRADLAAAGIPFETPEGVFDFHALRHQCGALLASAGVPIKAIQAHMRHASVRMTLDTYGHLLDVDRRAAADAMDAVCERVAQRGAFVQGSSGTTDGNAMKQITNNQWSDGESNPDLLNAIQHSSTLNVWNHLTLTNDRGKRVAPGAARRLLHRLFVRASRRAK